jgi:hypothetical protein
VAPKPGQARPEARGLRRDVGDGVIENLISEMKTRAFRRAEQLASAE